MQLARCVLVRGATCSTVAVSQQPSWEEAGAGRLVRRPPPGRLELAALAGGKRHEDPVWGEAPREGGKGHRAQVERLKCSGVLPHSSTSLANQNGNESELSLQLSESLRKQRQEGVQETLKNNLMPDVGGSWL